MTGGTPIYGIMEPPQMFYPQIHPAMNHGSCLHTKGLQVRAVDVLFGTVRAKAGAVFGKDLPPLQHCGGKSLMVLLKKDRACKGLG